MMNTTPTLDNSVLSELIGDDRQEHYEFKIQFLKQAQTSLKKLAKAYEVKMPEQLKSEAHYLKTSAKAIGALKCAELLEKVEYSALDKNFSVCRSLLLDINQELAIIVKLVKQSRP